MTVFCIKLCKRNAINRKLTQSCIVSGKKCSLQIFYIGPSFRLVRKLNKKTSKLSTKDANVFQVCDVHQQQNMQKNALLIDKFMFSSENLQKCVDFLSKLQETMGQRLNLTQKTLLRLYQMFESTSITSMCFWSQNLIKCQLFGKQIHLSSMQKTDYLYIQPKLLGTDTWRKIESSYSSFVQKESGDQSKNQLLGVQNDNSKPKPPKLEFNNKQYLRRVFCLRKCRQNSSQQAYSAENISRLCFMPTHNNLVAKEMNSEVRKQKRYTRQQRLELVRLVEDEKRTISSAAKQLGICEATAQTMMRFWRKKGKVFEDRIDQQVRMACIQSKILKEQDAEFKELIELHHGEKEKSSGQKPAQGQVDQVKVEAPQPQPQPEIKQEQNVENLPNPEPTFIPGGWWYYHPYGMMFPPPMGYYPWI